QWTTAAAPLAKAMSWGPEAASFGREGITSSLPIAAFDSTDTSCALHGATRPPRATESRQLDGNHSAAAVAGTLDALPVARPDCRRAGTGSSLSFSAPSPLPADARSLPADAQED